MRTHSESSITQVPKYTLKRLIEETVEAANSKKKVIRDKKGNVRYTLKVDKESYIL